MYCRWPTRLDYSHYCSVNTDIMHLTSIWGPNTLHFYGLSSITKSAQIWKQDRSHLALHLLTVWLWYFLSNFSHQNMGTVIPTILTRKLMKTKGRNTCNEPAYNMYLCHSCCPANVIIISIYFSALLVAFPLTHPFVLWYKDYGAKKSQAHEATFLVQSHTPNLWYSQITNSKLQLVKFSLYFFSFLNLYLDILSLSFLMLHHSLQLPSSPLCIPHREYLENFSYLL